ncbi:MAG: hypothetical protein JWO94_349 [Verrucomicrobiaceae bacterium]|nr:hypothetical protein [Verrucomicrobiaceae bacterium]
MKLIYSLVTAIFMAHMVATSALAQEFVTERSVLLTATILSQGPDASVTTLNGDTTITSKRVISTPFGGRELLGMMQGRQLIGGPVTGWGLVFLTDADGKGSLFAHKEGELPIPVPGDLLTVPDFVAKVTTGMTVAGPEGGTFGGLAETAFATLTVSGVPVSGLANSGLGKNDVSRGVSPDSATTTLTFAGGIFNADGDRIVKGVIVIGSSKGLLTAPVPSLK